MIRQVAVIGTGTMGRGIAYLAAVGPRATVSELRAPDAEEEPAMEKAS